ncbi:hypothetical protein GW17_00008870 [Ensete ventricosum]|nr:hypothetical protein GW17_00008870 [Ensete ventricosum]
MAQAVRGQDDAEFGQAQFIQEAAPQNMSPQQVLYFFSFCKLRSSSLRRFHVCVGRVRWWFQVNDCCSYLAMRSPTISSVMPCTRTC